MSLMQLICNQKMLKMHIFCEALEAEGSFVAENSLTAESILTEGSLSRSLFKSPP